MMPVYGASKRDTKSFVCKLIWHNQVTFKTCAWQCKPAETFKTLATPLSCDNTNKLKIGILNVHPARETD